MIFFRVPFGAMSRDTSQPAGGPLWRAARFMNRDRPRAAATVALLLLLFLLPRALSWGGVTMTSYLSFHDMPQHLCNADFLYKELTVEPEARLRPLVTDRQQMAMPFLPSRWTRGLYVLSLPLVALFGPLSIWTTQLINLLFSVVLALAAYLLGRRLVGPGLGRWSAALVLLCPPLMASSWYYSMDYPLVGMVLMGLFLLWRTRGFTLLWPSALFGAWSGVGLLIKISFPYYLVGPSLYVLYLGLRRGPRLRVLCGLPLSLAACLGLFYLVQQPEWMALWEELRMHSSVDLAGAEIRPYTVEWLLALVTFAAHNFPWPLLLLALPGLVVMHLGLRKATRAGDLQRLLLVFFWSTLLLLTLMPNKMERYLHPLYPLLCLLSLWWIFHWLRGRVRAVVLAGTAAAYLGMLVATQIYPTPWGLVPDQRGTADPLWYEFTMPSRHDINGLRQYTYNPEMRLGPLLEQAESWIRQGSMGRTAVPMLWVEQRELPDRAVDAQVQLLLTLAQRHPDRYVFALKKVTNGQPMPRELMHTHTFLLMHRPGFKLERYRDAMEVLDTEVFSYNATPPERTVVMSLARPRPRPAR